MPIIEFKHVQMRFGERIIHKDLNFSIEESETLTILGPSGTGKTLIFKMLIGLLRPTAGEIYFRGERIDTLAEKDFISIRKNIGMLFQGAALFDSLSVYENVAYSLREAGIKDESKIKSTVLRCLSFVDLEDFSSRFPLQLSGGQKKRVGLARALASSPAVILFDEPTTGLDPTSAKLIDDLIIRLRDEEGITSVVITHDMASARRISNRWLLVSNGIVQALGTVADLEQNNQLVRSFVTGNWQQ